MILSGLIDLCYLICYKVSLRSTQPTSPPLSGGYKLSIVFYRYLNTSLRRVVICPPYFMYWYLAIYASLWNVMACHCYSHNGRPANSFSLSYARPPKVYHNEQYQKCILPDLSESSPRYFDHGARVVGKPVGPG